MGKNVFMEKDKGKKRGKSGALLMGSSLVLTQMMASGAPQQNVSAGFFSWLNPFNWGWFTALWEKFFGDSINKAENLSPIIGEPGTRKEKGSDVLPQSSIVEEGNDKNEFVEQNEKERGDVSQQKVKKDNEKNEENQNEKKNDDIPQPDGEQINNKVEENKNQDEEAKSENLKTKEKIKEENVEKKEKREEINEKNENKKEEKEGKYEIKEKHVENNKEEISGKYFEQAVEMLKKEYPENFKYDSNKGSVYGEYTGDVSVKGDLKLSVSVKSLDPEKNKGKKYQAEFFGRKFYFETDKDLLEHVKKHAEYRSKLKNYIKKFKEVEATGKFTLKVVKTEEGYHSRHKIVLKIVDWSNLRFKERKGSCVSGLEIVLDHYEDEPVIVERYNAYRTVTPFYESYDDGVHVSSTNYAFTRPENEELLYNLFEDLLKSIEDYRKKYVERSKKSFDKIFGGDIKWEKVEKEGELKGTFEIKGFKFPVEIFASKGPNNYGKICGERFLKNGLPSQKEYTEWLGTFRYVFENCYEKFKMCEKGKNFEVSVNEKNVIVLSSKNGSTINVPGVILGSYYHRDDSKWLDKKDTVAVNKIEFDVVSKKINIYSEDGRVYCYKLEDLGAWHLHFEPDAPFETRFNRFLDHLVSEVEKMSANSKNELFKQTVVSNQEDN